MRRYSADCHDRLLFLPCSFPDCRQNAPAFANVKQALDRAEARSFEALVAASGLPPPAHQPRQPLSEGLLAWNLASRDAPRAAMIACRQHPPQQSHCDCRGGQQMSPTWLEQNRGSSPAGQHCFVSLL
jgi:hypothetical protein